MNAHDRAVDHLNLAVVSFRHGVHQAIPDASLSPAVEAIVGRRVRPISVGQIAPWRSGSQHPENPVEHTAIVLWARPRPSLRQCRLYDAPHGFRSTGLHDVGASILLRTDPLHGGSGQKY